MTAELKQIVASRIDALADELITVSHDIHAHPELAFNEHHASELLCNALTSAGLAVKRSAYGLETAFESEFNGTGAGPRVALLAEYDALPGIGHACGHNLIATSALGATLGLAAIRDHFRGTVRLLGTPAEEKGGGKELMARAGAFGGVDAAMMIHPSGINLTTMPCICVAEVRVEYHGRAAHASAMPHRGINALEACCSHIRRSRICASTFRRLNAFTASSRMVASRRTSFRILRPATSTFAPPTSRTWRG